MSYEGAIKGCFCSADERFGAGGAATVGAGTETPFGFSEGVGGEHDLPVVFGEALTPRGQVQREGGWSCLAEAGGGAGPGPVGSLRDERGADRVSFDVADGGPAVFVV